MHNAVFLKWVSCCCRVKTWFAFPITHQISWQTSCCYMQKLLWPFFPPETITSILTLYESQIFLSVSKWPLISSVTQQLQSLSQLTVKISPCLSFIRAKNFAASFPNSRACPSHGIKPLSRGGSFLCLWSTRTRVKSYNKVTELAYLAFIYLNQQVWNVTWSYVIRAFYCVVEKPRSTETTAYSRRTVLLELVLFCCLKTKLKSENLHLIDINIWIQRYCLIIITVHSFIWLK